MNTLTWEGLLDCVHLANVVELTYLWKPETYIEDSYSNRSLEEAQIGHIRDRILEFKKEFSKRQWLKRGDKLFDAVETLFNPSILRFAVMIYKYKGNTRNYNSTFTPFAFKEKIIQHFRKHHPDLCIQVAEDMDKGLDSLPYCKSFRWMDGEFEIVAKAQSSSDVDIEIISK
jgi:hypothetical protein